jgi:hypothetical protein
MRAIRRFAGVVLLVVRYGLLQVSDGADGVPLARKPKVVDPDAGSEPLYEAFETVTFEPLLDSVPLHTWVIVWPLPRAHLTLQPLTAELPAVTVTSPWKPPGHEPTVR